MASLRDGFRIMRDSIHVPFLYFRVTAPRSNYSSEVSVPSVSALVEELKFLALDNLCTLAFFRSPLVCVFFFVWLQQ